MVPYYENRQKTSSDPLAFCVKPEIGRFEKRKPEIHQKLRNTNCVYTFEKIQQNNKIYE